jgi:radical SAM superfamily enzyme YgiQ (UPF0313 family)
VSQDKRKVVLVNPNRMKPAVAPLALDYLAHALRESHFEVDILDLCFADAPEEAIGAYFARNSPLAIGVSLRNTDDTYFASQDFFLPAFKEVIDTIRAHTQAPIILGGAGFSVMPKAILDFCNVDLGIWGEGEQALPFLLRRMVAGEGYDDVPGLIWRSEKGLVSNSPSYLSPDEKVPRRSAVDNRRYFLEGGMGAIEGKRGCSKTCIYCADPLGKGRRVRLRSPESVAREIEALLEQGIDHLHFCDSEFNIPEAHAREVCLELVKRGLGEKVRWYTYASPVPFSDELAALLRRAGCAGINFGADSASDGVLRTLGRDFTVQDLERTADICHRQGITFMFDLLLGGPGETRDTLRQTVEAMKRLSPDRVGASLGVRIFPGTELARMVQSQGPLGQNPDLRGAVAQNDSFFAPVFYLSSALGPDPLGYLAELVGGDERFFVGARQGVDQNYNYNDNTALVDAIKSGYRGAFWDILRRLAQGVAPQ